jgi:hypothetical protein
MVDMFVKQLQQRSARTGLSSKLSDYPARRIIRPATLAAQTVEGFPQVDQKQWEECKHRIQELGVRDPDEAERILKESFGWSGQAFWTGEKVSMFILLAHEQLYTLGERCSTAALQK